LISRLFFATAFLLGAAAIAAMGLTFIASDPLGLVVTVVIGGVYGIGFIEILQFRQATSTLSNALSGLSATTPEVGPGFLEQWLARLHPSLQNSVRLRIEGERVGLPAPVITPYLVGLLVMLGLFGTFLGMVATLQGAVLALEGTTELQAIRAGLAAPIKGLGLAFGTSVAGVAASAMLGLSATISRRDRMSATRQLDSQVTTVFREFSLVYSRQQAFKAVQAQAKALPEVAERLHVLAAVMERMGEQLGEKLIANQERFHQSASSSYSELASSVDRSLRESVAESGRQVIESGRLLGENIRPLIEGLVTNIGAETQRTHQHLTLTAQQQLEGLSSSFLDSFDKRSTAWAERQQLADRERLAIWTCSFEQASERSCAQHQALSDLMKQTASEMADTARATSCGMLSEVSTLLQSSEALIETRINAEAAWLQGHGERMNELIATLKAELQALRNDEERRGQTAVASLAGLESTVAAQLASLGNSLEEPMTRLIQTASETPRAAAEVIAHLRREMSNNMDRDNVLLAERQRIMSELGSLATSLQQVSSGQREAVESLLTSSATLLEDVGSRFSGQVESEVSNLSRIAENLAGKAAQIADDFAGSAIEMSSLGEAFTLAVGLFNESNGKLVESLDHIEQSLTKATTRSDEQLAYYVAQAREIIDHSMLSQKEIFEELRQLRRPGKRASEPVREEVG
jgi:hypothetical protein